MIKFNLLFAWYDLWIGAFWDQARRKLYVLPIPCCGFVITFLPKPLPAGEFVVPKGVKRVTLKTFGNGSLVHDFEIKVVPPREDE